MKIIFFVLLEALYVSTQTFKGSCDYFRIDDSLKRLEKDNEFNTDEDLFCTFNCHLPENTEINQENTDCALLISLSKSNWQDYKNFSIVGPENMTDKFKLVVEEHSNYTSFVIYIVTKENKPLNYNEKEDYTFFIEAGNATGGELILVYVKINVCEPPVWTNFPSILKVDDPYSTLTPPIFNITATSGRGCENKSIKYFANNTAGKDGWVFVDRETGEGTILGLTPLNTSANYFSFDVFAYYVPHYSGERKGHVMVLIDDVDDNSPKMNPNGLIYFNVTENGITTYPINVNDIDLGYNSAFEVLFNVSEEIRDAVEINPTRGAGNTTLELKINSDKINVDGSYIFNIKINVRGVKTPSHGDSLLMEVAFPNKNSANRLGSIIWKTILLLWMISFWM